MRSPEAGTIAVAPACGRPGARRRTLPRPAGGVRPGRPCPGLALSSPAWPFRGARPGPPGYLASERAT
jgi:hypothetical protein